MATSEWTPVDEAAAKWTPVREPDYRASAQSKIQTYEQARKSTPWYKFGPPLPVFTPDESKTLTKGEEFMYGGNPGASEGKGFREGMAEYGEEGVGNVAKGTADIAKGDIAKGGHEVISGGLTALTPAMAMTAPAAPMTAVRSIAGGAGAGYVSDIVSDIAGATPEHKQLANDIATVIGGFSAGTGLPRAFLETSLKKAAVKTGAMDTVLDFLEKGPKQMAADWIRAQLKEFGATPETHPQTHEVVNQALGALNKPVAPTAQGPAPPSAPAAKPLPEGAYGKSAGRSNLSKNQRQLASPTGSTAPNPSAQGESPLANYMKAARSQLPEGSPETAVQKLAEAYKMQDDQMAALLQESLLQLKK